MTHAWEPKWTLKGRGRSGGQGRTGLVVDSEGRSGFLKELRRPRDARARARFRREVTSYETLAGHESLPELWDHNAAEWAQSEIGLYLVLEHIPGGTVGDFIRETGALQVASAIGFAERLCDIAQFCHENDVVHRDLKPENILLRNGSPLDPVIIDFGLAFNEIDGEPELTRVNEEVGNRFLRLPEHASGGRNPISDVAQLVGLLLYAATGREPRVLQDGEGRMPHQRPNVRRLIDELEATEPQVRRLLSVFDRGFATRTAARFQTAAQLREAMEVVLSDDPSTPSLDDLFLSLDTDVPADVRRRVADAAAAINAFRSALYTSLETVAKARSLEISWGNGPDSFENEPPEGIVRYTMSVPGVIPTTHIEWSVELVGLNEFTLSHQGEQVWRGSDQRNENLRDLVLAVLIDRFRASAG